MKHPLTILALFVAASVAHADHYRKYFPLKEGNTWTYQGDVETYVTDVDSWAGMHFVTGIPGAESGLWVAWSGNTLWAWRASDGTWVPLFRFGAGVGTTYTVSLDTPFLANAQFHVKSKSLSWTDPLLGVTFANCVHFVLLGQPTSGPGEYVFAPNRGLVMYAQQIEGGQTNFHLSSAVLNGKKYGLVSMQTMESGTYTQFQPPQTKQVLVINTQAQWEAFYARHNPGGEVPKADFTKQTILVVLAGERPTSGYSVKAKRVLWNYPTSSATVQVTETKQVSFLLQVLTYPYEILLLDGKVSSVAVEWTVEQN